MEKSSPKTILTVFSGRYDRMKVLVKYLRKAIDLDIIQEVHFWNFAKKESDALYLRSISNPKRLAGNARSFSELFLPLEHNQFTLDIRSAGNVCVMIQTTSGNQYEVWIGAVENRLTILRKGKQELGRVVQEGVVQPYSYKTFTFRIVSSCFQIMVNQETTTPFLSVPLDPLSPEEERIERVWVKGEQHATKIRFVTTVNKGFYLLEPCIKKPWTNYYQYYIDEEYRHDVILKCDDDITFLDLRRLPQFITFCRLNPQCDLIFANTVNNGVSAFFQQNVYNVIPKTVMELEYPEGGLNGSLWESGEKAHQLHQYFLSHSDLFLHQNHNSLIQILSRYSINFFAIRGENWSKMIYSGDNDEEDITVKKVAEGTFKNFYYSDFVVCHLSFFKQEEDPRLKVDELVCLYDAFATQYLSQF